MANAPRGRAGSGVPVGSSAASVGPDVRVDDFVAIRFRTSVLTSGALGLWVSLAVLGASIDFRMARNSIEGYSNWLTLTCEVAGATLNNFETIMTVAFGGCLTILVAGRTSLAFGRLNDRPVLGAHGAYARSPIRLGLNPRHVSVAGTLAGAFLFYLLGTLFVGLASVPNVRAACVSPSDLIVLAPLLVMAILLCAHLGKWVEPVQVRFARVVAETAHVRSRLNRVSRSPGALEALARAGPLLTIHGNLKRLLGRLAVLLRLFGPSACASSLLVAISWIIQGESVGEAAISGVIVVALFTMYAFMLYVIIIQTSQVFRALLITMMIAVGLVLASVGVPLFIVFVREGWVFVPMATGIALVVGLPLTMVLPEPCLRRRSRRLRHEERLAAGVWLASGRPSAECAAAAVGFRDRSLPISALAAVRGLVLIDSIEELRSSDSELEQLGPIGRPEDSQSSPCRTFSRAGLLSSGEAWVATCGGRHKTRPWPNRIRGRAQRR